MALSTWDYSPPFIASVTTTGIVAGSTVDLAPAGKMRDEFVIEAKGTGAAPTALTAALEGSIDGVNWTSLQAITQANDGQMLNVAQKLCNKYRINVTALTLGGASNVVFTLLAA